MISRTQGVPTLLSIATQQQKNRITARPVNTKRRILCGFQCVLIKVVVFVSGVDCIGDVDKNAEERTSKKEEGKEQEQEQEQEQAQEQEQERQLARRTTIVKDEDGKTE